MAFSARMHTVQSHQSASLKWQQNWGELHQPTNPPPCTQPSTLYLFSPHDGTRKKTLFCLSIRNKHQKATSAMGVFCHFFWILGVPVTLQTSPKRYWYQLNIGTKWNHLRASECLVSIPQLNGLRNGFTVCHLWFTNFCFDLPKMNECTTWWLMLGAGHGWTYKHCQRKWHLIIGLQNLELVFCDLPAFCQHK